MDSMTAALLKQREKMGLPAKEEVIISAASQRDIVNA